MNDDEKARAMADAFKPLADLAGKYLGDGGPAFPLSPCARCGVDHEPHTAETFGMSLRDYIAIKAAASLLVGASGMLDFGPSAYAKGHCNAVIADRAYVFADMMLRRRTQT